MSYDFSGRQVLVTGGATGIGRAIARRFAEQHAAVTVTGLLPDDLAACHTALPNVTAKILDVTDADAVAMVIGGCESLDVVVNCAGTIARGGREHDPVEFARIVDVNLTGTMRVCAAARPTLARRRGCVVNLASMLSFFGSGFVPAYSASKGGIVQLTRSLAIAWAAEGIRVNAVAPGWIETALTQPLIDDDSRRREIIARTPLGRWGRPDDVAGPVLFLCSPDSAFITGAVLPVDGGYLVA